MSIFRPVYPCGIGTAGIRLPHAGRCSTRRTFRSFCLTRWTARRRNSSSPLLVSPLSVAETIKYAHPFGDERVATGGAMLDADTSLLREWVMPRLRSGQSIAAIAAATGVSQSTLYRWKRQSMGVTTKLPAPPQSARIRTAVVPAPATPTPASPAPIPVPPAPTPVLPAPAAVPAEMPVLGYVGDVTGPGITDQWGVTC